MTRDEYLLEHKRLTEEGVALALHILRGQHSAAEPVLDELWHNMNELRRHRYETEDEEKFRHGRWRDHLQSRRDNRHRR